MADAKAGCPELAWDAWKDTATTLHMWTQVVGKTRLALTPMQNHWWNVPLICERARADDFGDAVAGGCAGGGVRLHFACGTDADGIGG